MGVCFEESIDWYDTDSERMPPAGNEHSKRHVPECGSAGSADVSEERVRHVGKRVDHKDSPSKAPIGIACTSALENKRLVSERSPQGASSSKSASNEAKRRLLDLGQAPGRRFKGLSQNER